VSGHHALATLAQKRTPVPTEVEAEWAPEPVSSDQDLKTLVLPTYSLVAIPMKYVRPQRMYLETFPIVLIDEFFL